MLLFPPPLLTPHSLIETPLFHFIEFIGLVREWVAKRTGKTSVPQIFFNSTYVGGNLELNKAFSNPERKAELLKVLEEEENTGKSNFISGENLFLLNVKIKIELAIPGKTVLDIIMVKIYFSSDFVCLTYVFLLCFVLLLIYLYKLYAIRGIKGSIWILNR